MIAKRTVGEVSHTNDMAGVSAPNQRASSRNRNGRTPGTVYGGVRLVQRSRTHQRDVGSITLDVACIAVPGYVQYATRLSAVMQARPARRHVAGTQAITVSRVLRRNRRSVPEGIGGRRVTSPVSTFAASASQLRRHASRQPLSIHVACAATTRQQSYAGVGSWAFRHGAIESGCGTRRLQRASLAYGIIRHWLEYWSAGRRNSVAARGKWRTTKPAKTGMSRTVDG